MRGWRKSQKNSRKYPQKTISFFFVNLKKMKMVFARDWFSSRLSVAVARTSQSPFPLCDMASKITLRNKLHDFEWIKKKLNPDQKCVKTRSEFIFKLDWLNKIRTWLKKLISDTISLTENVRENNLTRQNHSAEKILTENPTQNLSEKIFEF